MCQKNALQGFLLDACILDVTETGNASLANMNEYTKDLCPSQCSFKGKCVGILQCECFEGWSGDDCSLAFCEFDCGEYGSCLNGVCQCEIGWEDQNCSTRVSCEQVNNCTDYNHGVCIRTNECECFEGFMGTSCNLTISCALLSDCSGK